MNKKVSFLLKIIINKWNCYIKKYDILYVKYIINFF